MKRGEVWWADLPPPTGRRPVILLSRDEAYDVRALVIIAPVTTRIRSIPAEVPLGPEDGLPKPCVVNCDVLATVEKALLKERIAILSPSKLRLLDIAVRFALGLDAAG